MYTGGAEKSLMEIIRVAKKAGHICHVVVPAEGDFSRRLKEEKINHTIQDYTWSITSPSDPKERDTQISADYNANSIIAATKVLQKFQPDVVIINTITTPWYAYASHALNIPSILLVSETLDALDPETIRPSTANYLLLLSTCVSFVLFNSHHTKENYTSRGYFTEKPYDIQSPIITLPKTLKTINTELNTPPYSLLCIGAIYPLKNQLSVVKALNNLTPAIRQQFTLTITGSIVDTAYFKQIEKYIEKNQLTEQVRILPHTENPLEHIQEHNCLIMASETESFGRVTAEGCLLGRIVIGRNTGATPEIITQHKTGVLYETDKHPALTDALKWIATHPKEANAIAKTAQKITQKKYQINPCDTFLKTIHTVHTQAKQTHIPYFDPIYALVHRNQSVDKKINEYAASLTEAAKTIKHLEKTVAAQEKNIKIQEKNIVELQKSPFKKMYEKIRKNKS